MEWTKETPKEEGWYWCYAKEWFGGPFVNHVIREFGKLYISDQNCSGGLAAWRAGMNFDVYWLGPLPPPAPPKEA